jgi:oligopeptide/dipeptide ABC transporter ATP-binding protein
MEAGIVGLPNVGKSTLFNALTAAGIASENYPFCTIEPNVGAVPVPDPKVEATRSRIRLDGAVPSPLDEIQGCAFRSRCPKAFDRCAGESPGLKEHAPGHWAACHLPEM